MFTTTEKEKGSKRKTLKHLIYLKRKRYDAPNASLVMHMQPQRVAHSDRVNTTAEDRVLAGETPITLVNDAHVTNQ